MTVKLHNLNRAKGQNRYCGPAVISFLTGVNTNEAALLIRKTTGQVMVTGTSTWGVRQVLKQFGLDTTPAVFKQGQTLAAWLREFKHHRSAGRMFLVVAGHHFQLITGRRYACGRIGEITGIKDPRVKRRARVAEVFEVVGALSMTPPALSEAKDEAQRKRALYAADRKPRAAVRALERLDYVEVERENGIIWVGPGLRFSELGGIGDRDPYEGDHYVDTWPEAQERAEEYRRLWEQLRYNPA